VAGLTVGDLVALLTQVGPMGLLLVMVVALVRQEIVPGRLYRDMRDERDLLRDKLFQTLETARRATDVADRATRRGESPP
jgi:hypothetical protein